MGGEQGGQFGLVLELEEGAREDVVRVDVLQALAV